MSGSEKNDDGIFAKLGKPGRPVKANFVIGKRTGKGGCMVESKRVKCSQKRK